jgi:hypothetical protein
MKASRAGMKASRAGPARPAAMLRAVILPALRESRRDTAWLAAWSVVEALPGLVFGRAVAGAIDAWHGGGGAPVAFGWLGALLAASAAGRSPAARPSPGSPRSSSPCATTSFAGW